MINGTCVQATVYIGPDTKTIMYVNPNLVERMGAKDNVSGLVNVHMASGERLQVVWNASRDFIECVTGRKA